MYAQLFILFAIIFAGFFMRRIGLIDGSMNAGVSKIVIYFAYPCLIINLTGTMEIDSKLIRDFIIVIALSAVLSVVYGAFAIIYTKLRRIPKDKAGVMCALMTTPNNGFMGMPVALVFLGPKGLLFMIGSVIINNVYQFTYDRAVISSEKGVTITGKMILKMLSNPNIIGIVVGLIICFNGISLDNPIGNFLTTVGNIAIPLAMIYIGSNLAESRIGEVIKEKEVWESMLVKLILMPVVATIAIILLPLSPEVKAILILANAFPAAAVPVMIAGEEGRDVGLASRILFFTTVVSMVTLPVIMWLLERGFGF